jgi:hypothetical protein
MTVYAATTDEAVRIQEENKARAELEKFESLRVAIERGKAGDIRAWAAELGLNAEQVQFCKMCVAGVTEFEAKKQEAQAAERIVERLIREKEALEESVKDTGYVSADIRRRHEAISAELARQRAIATGQWGWHADPRHSVPQLYAIECGGDHCVSYSRIPAAGTWASKFLHQNGVDLTAGGTWLDLGRPKKKATTAWHDVEQS